jgi:hypothetical protein
MSASGPQLSLNVSFGASQMPIIARHYLHPTRAALMDEAAVGARTGSGER